MTWTALIEECATGDRNLFLRLAPPSPSPAGRIWNHLISRLADGPTYFLIALYALWMQSPQALAFCLCLAGGFMLELPLYKGIKQRYKRPRPCHSSLNRSNLMHIPDEYSFPSGHTAGAFVLAGNLAAFFSSLTLVAYLFALAVGSPGSTTDTFPPMSRGALLSTSTHPLWPACFFTLYSGCTYMKADTTTTFTPPWILKRAAHTATKGCSISSTCCWRTQEVQY